MDFFDRQDKARRNTKWLVIYFVLGVAALVAAVYFAALLLVGGVSIHSSHRYYGGVAEAAPLWNPSLFFAVAVGTLSVVALGSLFKTMELARGGSAVAAMLGGRLVSPTTTQPDERKLLNVVEEMAIAAGIPVPQVYLLPEQGINAFAAGHTVSDAVVAVTQGSIKLLSRDELQGVVGHEFSHILNGDMRLNIRLMGAIFGILCLAIIGRILLQTRGDRRNPLPLLGLALLLIGWVGVFFGRLIQAAVSRQREYLADASSVQFTRNPAGLSGALQKIGGYNLGSRMKSPQAEQASHMFFSSGVRAPFFGLMATHPPLERRIRAIDPSWDGTFPPLAAATEAEAVQLGRAAGLGSASISRPSRAAVIGQTSPAGLAGTRGGWVGVERYTGPLPPVITAGSLLASAGLPTTDHLRQAAGVRESIPASLQAAAREPLGASALVYALLLSQNEAARRSQLEQLAAINSAEIRDEAVRLLPDTRTVVTTAKLPLIDLALPGLRSLSPVQFQQFRAALKALVETDGKIDLFEYVLQKIVLRHLEPCFVSARKPIVQYYSLAPLLPSCAVLLSAMAHAGQDDPFAIKSAFEQGARVFGSSQRLQLALLDKNDCGLDRVDAALTLLAQAAPQIKKNVLTACAQTAAADGWLAENEAELLRAIADSLDCPLPPPVQGLSNQQLAPARQFGSAPVGA